MIEELTYHTFNLKRKAVEDAEKNLRSHREELRKAENEIQSLGLNPHNLTQPEFEEARKRKREDALKKSPAPKRTRKSKRQRNPHEQEQKPPTQGRLK